MARQLDQSTLQAVEKQLYKGKKVKPDPQPKAGDIVSRQDNVEKVEKKK